MGLFSRRNINTTKRLFDKNTARIADGVDKATDMVDKKTGGKHVDKLKKVDDAVAKMAGRAAAATESAPTDADPGADTGDSTTS